MDDFTTFEDRPVKPSTGLKLRRIFLAGIFTVIPVYVTMVVIQILLRFMDNILAPVVERVIGFRIPGLGLVLVVLFLFILGLAVTNILGRGMINMLERFVMKIPVVSSIYSTIKQIVQTFSPDKRGAFQKVIWLEYPRRGVWSLGFVTGKSASSDGTAYYNVFIATTPNPTSGLVILIPQAESVEAGMTVEEGFKFLISGGMITADMHAFPHIEDGHSKAIMKATQPKLARK